MNKKKQVMADLQRMRRFYGEWILKNLRIPIDTNQDCLRGPMVDSFSRSPFHAIPTP